MTMKIEDCWMTFTEALEMFLDARETIKNTRLQFDREIAESNLEDAKKHMDAITFHILLQVGAVNEPDPSKCFNAAINYTLKCGIGDGGLEFLACWREGNFDAIRKEWPDAPSEVFEGAEAAKGGV